MYLTRNRAAARSDIRLHGHSFNARQLRLPLHVGLYIVKRDGRWLYMQMFAMGHDGRISRPFYHGGLAACFASPTATKNTYLPTSWTTGKAQKQQHMQSSPFPRLQGRHPQNSRDARQVPLEWMSTPLASSNCEAATETKHLDTVRNPSARTKACKHFKANATWRLRELFFRTSGTATARSEDVRGAW